MRKDPFDAIELPRRTCQCQSLSDNIKNTPLSETSDSWLNSQMVIYKAWPKMVALSQEFGVVSIESFQYLDPASSLHRSGTNKSLHGNKHQPRVDEFNGGSNLSSEKSRVPKSDPNVTLPLPRFVEPGRHGRHGRHGTCCGHSRRP